MISQVIYFVHYVLKSHKLISWWNSVAVIAEISQSGYLCCTKQSCILRITQLELTKNQLCRLADLIDDNVMPSSWPPALRALIYSHAGLKKCFIAVTDTFRCLAYTAKPPLNDTIVSQRDGLCCYSCAQTAPLLTDYKDFSVPPKALCPLLLITLMSIITRRWCGKSKTSIQC